MKKIICVAVMAALLISLTACSPAFIKNIMTELDKDDYNDNPSLSEKLGGVETAEPSPPAEQTAQQSPMPALPANGAGQSVTFAQMDPLGLLAGSPMTGAELASSHGFEKQGDFDDGVSQIYRKDIDAPAFADKAGENYAETVEENGATVFASYYYDISEKSDAASLLDFINAVEDAVSAQAGSEKASSMIYFGGEDFNYDRTGRLTEQEAAKLTGGTEGYGYTMYGGSWTVGTDMLDVYFSVMNDRVRMNIMRGYGSGNADAGITENAAELPSTTDAAGGYEFGSLGADNPRPITTAEQIAADPGVKTGSSTYSQFTEYTKPMDIMGRQGEMYVVAEGEKIYTIGYKINSAATDTAEDMARLFSDMTAFAEDIAGSAPDEAVREGGGQLDFDQLLNSLQKGENAEFKASWQMDGYTLNAVITVEGTESAVSLVYYFN